jgi:hypothetical protein
LFDRLRPLKLGENMFLTTSLKDQEELWTGFAGFARYRIWHRTFSVVCEGNVKQASVSPPEE